MIKLFVVVFLLICAGSSICVGSDEPTQEMSPAPVALNTPATLKASDTLFNVYGCPECATDDMMWFYYIMTWFGNNSTYML